MLTSAESIGVLSPEPEFPGNESSVMSGPRRQNAGLFRPGKHILPEVSNKSHS